MEREREGGGVGQAGQSGGVLAPATDGAEPAVAGAVGRVKAVPDESVAAAPEAVEEEQGTLPVRLLVGLVLVLVMVGALLVILFFALRG